MSDKIKQLYKTYLPYVLELQDVRVLGLVVFAVVVLLISWSGIRTIDTNYRLQKEIATLKQQNDVQNLQDENQKLQNQYYKTNQYLELSARSNFGLAQPGEVELVVPKSVALSYTVDLPSATTTSAVAQAKQSTFQRNFQAWVDFFLHRNATL